ncbi:MAG: hypothetical protein Q7T55_07780, partial [Solirubrobacteraceae bacterium]|nr:hypothetical protein [Solirubrobacteraceae bacterium]
MARGTDTDDARLTTLASTVLAALALALLAGCGSATVAELPPPAGPDRAPARTSVPADELLAPTTPPAAATPLARDRFRDGTLEAVGRLTEVGVGASLELE